MLPVRVLACPQKWLKTYHIYRIMLGRLTALIWGCSLCFWVVSIKCWGREGVLESNWLRGAQVIFTPDLFLEHVTSSRVEGSIESYHWLFFLIGCRIQRSFLWWYFSSFFCFLLVLGFSGKACGIEWFFFRQDAVGSIVLPEKRLCSLLGKGHFEAESFRWCSLFHKGRHFCMSLHEADSMIVRKCFTQISSSPWHLCPDSHDTIALHTVFCILLWYPSDLSALPAFSQSRRGFAVQLMNAQMRTLVRRRRA